MILKAKVRETQTMMMMMIWRTCLQGSSEDADRADLWTQEGKEREGQTENSMETYTSS